MVNLASLLGDHALSELEFKERKKDPLEQAREAIRAYEAEKTQDFYFRVYRATKGKVKNHSIGHAAMAFLHGINELTESAYVQAAELLKSELVGELIKEKYGKKIPVKEAIIRYVKETANAKPTIEEMLSGKRPLPIDEKTIDKALEKVSAGVQRSQVFAEKLLAYSKKSRKSFREILDSEQDRIKVKIQTYGSKEAYQQVLETSAKSSSELRSKLSAYKQIPVGAIVENFLGENADIEEISKANIDLAKIAEIPQSYFSDILMFSEAFFSEAEKAARKEIRALNKKDSK